MGRQQAEMSKRLGHGSLDEEIRKDAASTRVQQED